VLLAFAVVRCDVFIRTERKRNQSLNGNSSLRKTIGEDFPAVSVTAVGPQRGAADGGGKIGFAQFKLRCR
jgi:hypothetical protein